MNESELIEAAAARLRRNLCYAVNARVYGDDPLAAALQKLKTAKPRELSEKRIEKIHSLMRFATNDEIGLENAFQLLDALGKDPDEHPEAVALLDEAFRVVVERREREEREERARADAEREARVGAGKRA